MRRPRSCRFEPNLSAGRAAWLFLAVIAVVLLAFPASGRAAATPGAGTGPSAAAAAPIAVAGSGPVVGPGPVAASQSAVDVRALDAYFASAQREWDIPGMAVAIVKDGEVVLATGYGVRDMDDGGEVDENTMFAIASNSKAFTSAALAMLVDEGKMSWSDPVTKFFTIYSLIAVVSAHSAATSSGTPPTTVPMKSCGGHDTFPRRVPFVLPTAIPT